MHNVSDVGQVAGGPQIANLDNWLSAGGDSLSNQTCKPRHRESNALSGANVCERPGDEDFKAAILRPLMTEHLARCFSHRVRTHRSKGSRFFQRKRVTAWEPIDLTGAHLQKAASEIA